MAQLGNSSYPVEPALAYFRSIPRQATLALVQVYFIKGYRQEKPGDSCLVTSFPCCNGYRHCTDCVCRRGKLCYRTMALQIRTFAARFFFYSLYQTRTEEIIIPLTRKQKKGYFLPLFLHQCFQRKTVPLHKQKRI